MPNNVGSSLGGGSLVFGTSQSSFDVCNESDVISLLKVVHLNPISPDIKNHLRDLIFTFRQNQNESEFSKLKEAFLSLGVTVVNGAQAETQQAVTLQVNKNNIAVEKKSTLGNVYRQPKFAPVILKNAAPIVPTPEQKIVVPPVVQNAAVAQDVVTQSPVSAPQITVTASPSQMVNHTERIKEIKKIVNEKVGNPVNLIDANNEVGREYMNALLDAMKKSNGGVQQEVEAAMTRLENAFTQVREVIIDGKMSTVAEKPSETSTTFKTASPIEAKIVSEKPNDFDKNVLAGGYSLQEEEKVREQAATAPVISVEPSIASSFKESLPEVTAETQKNVTKMSSVMDTLNITKSQVENKNTSNEHALVHSVAKEKQLQDLMRANREKVAETYQQQESVRIAAMDPLQVPEVTAGLGQLLSEWGLFKSSGIFGTGPSGKDHVLYLKLAPLTMATVIAGRFEGATPHIKQSITDYMNGWRYEEGIVHEHGETFEHYLRRVIKHILEKQRRK